MQERATALGGTLALDDAPGGGLLVTACLPLRQENAADAPSSGDPAPADTAPAETGR
jgi:signal transduction histidine kinase